MLCASVICVGFQPGSQATKDSGVGLKYTASTPIRKPQQDGKERAVPSSCLGILGLFSYQGAGYINRFQIKVSQITSGKLHFSCLVNDFWSLKSIRYSPVSSLAWEALCDLVLASGPPCLPSSGSPFCQPCPAACCVSRLRV